MADENTVDLSHPEVQAAMAKAVEAAVAAALAEKEEAAKETKPPVVFDSTSRDNYR